MPGDALVVDLNVAPVGRDAALYAVQRWHYSRSFPVARTARFGVWENGRFVGVVVFSNGATPRLGQRYGLTNLECIELTRVALRDHVSPVSQIVASALRQLKASSPGLRLVVSFADPAEGHHGGIYQAGNWIYTGALVQREYYEVLGRVMHPRNVGAHGWRQSLSWLRANVDPNARAVSKPGKHRYLYPLDKPTRRAVRRLAKPYPSAITARNRKSGDKVHAVEASEVTRGGSTAESRVRSPATAPTTRTGGEHG